MGIKRGFFRFSIFMVILMPLFMPFTRSSSTSIQRGAEVAEHTETLTKELESKAAEIFWNGGSVLTVEEREVPTGPDPLHHNDNPTGP